MRPSVPPAPAVALYLLGVVVIATDPGGFWLGMVLAGIPMADPAPTLERCRWRSNVQVESLWPQVGPAGVALTWRDRSRLVTLPRWPRRLPPSVWTRHLARR